MPSTDEIVGTLTDARFPAWRYRIGGESGDVFETDDDFDGTALTIEVDGVEEGQRLFEAIAAYLGKDAE